MRTSKGDMLAWLAPRLTRGRVLPLVHFDVAEWRADRAGVLARVMVEPFAAGLMIVRSSALSEDTAESSQAGRFLSLAGVDGERALGAAIDQVIGSYDGAHADHRVLVQPHLDAVVASGVVFTRDPASGAPYVVVNYYDGHDTAAVTGGRVEDLATFYCWKGAAVEQTGLIAELLSLADELEQLLG